MSKVDYRIFYPMLPAWQLTTPPPPRAMFRWWGKDKVLEAGEWTRQRKRQQHRRLAKELRRRAVRR